MATIAEFSLPSDSFPLGSLFAELPDVTVELERVVPTNDALIPYVWVRGASPAEEERIEASASAHSDVREVALVDEVDGEYLLRVEWVSDHEGILRAIAETRVTLLSGFGTADTWTIEIRSESRDALSAFQRYCSNHGIPVEINEVRTLSALGSGAVHDLTDTQREALVLAYERGYYQSPREVSLDELAEEVGITGQSFGSRLRRGIHRLIGSTLADGTQ